MADNVMSESALNNHIKKWNEKLDVLAPHEILKWIWDEFGDGVVAGSSFQTQSVPLLHMISVVCPEMRVVFIDTGFHFPETLTFRDRLVKDFNLNIVNVRSAVEESALLTKYGGALYNKDPDMCCYINKVEPFQRILAGLKGWISGVRRDQTEHRKTLKVVEMQDDGLLKLHPLINWTKKDVSKYIEQYKLPAHPLHAKGYPSIGCEPCTRPVTPGCDERSGRWAGTGKTECGLHISKKNQRGGAK